MRELFRKVRWLLKRRGKEAELREELQFHLDEETECRLTRGRGEDEARRAARCDLGNLRLVEEDTRAEWGWRRLEQFGRDLRHGLRQIRRSPGFATVAIVTLALGIGGVTAIFSAFHAVLIRSLPYSDADRLVVIWDEAPRAQIPKLFATPAEWLVWRRLNTAFTDLAATTPAGASLSGDSEPEQVPARTATANLWSVLGVSPLIGRVFTQSEDENGAKVVVISYGLWQRRFGGSPDALGRPLIVNDESFTVIGVMPRDFYCLPAANIDVWLPASFPPWMRTNFGWHSAQVIARLKPGVTIASATESMAALSVQVTAKLNSGPHGVILTPLREEIAGKTRSALVLLLFAAATLLLIACVNLANLLMSRGAARGREVLVRAALGASYGRLVAHFLAEGLVLSGFGAAAGFVLAVPAMRFLETLTPAAMGTLHLTMGWRVLARCAALAVTTTLVFGLAPALRGCQLARQNGLRQGDCGAATARGRWFQHSLVVVETALAVVLLASGGILIETFAHLRRTELGFRPAHVLTFETVLFRYPQFDREVTFVNAMLERIGAVPGVVTVGASNELPLRVKDMVATFYLLDGQTRDVTPGQVALMRVVTRGYFSTIGAGLSEGRFFDSSDRRSGKPVAIVNETFAKRHFPGRSALGARFKYGQLDDNGYWYTIVGVVKEVRETAMAEDPRPVIYRLLEQTEQLSVQPSSVAVRTSGDPASIVPAIRQAIWSVDRDQPVWRFETLDEVVDRQFATVRQSTTLMSAFALLALLLASVGLYGVLSYAVTQRTGEIGVRMALGATSGDIVRSFVSRGFALTLSGLVGGSVLATIVMPLMTPLLYGWRPEYVPLFAGTVCVLLTVATLACVLPARRASRTDPVIALRSD
ncbi:MAG TPA: ABC transporter permease [Vicinamibacterales bacterium]